MSRNEDREESHAIDILLHFTTAVVAVAMRAVTSVAVTEGFSQVAREVKEIAGE